MCGIGGFFESERTFTPDFLNQVERDLYHRGPDSGGQYLAPGSALVFRRLAIIDPQSRSDQPMFDQSGRYVLLFNGEIYNYRRLRDELEASNVPLRTQGDSEVIIEGFAAWGESIFEKLEGMFACVILDTQAKRVWAARDPLGIKPLYFAREPGRIAFASEIRPLRRFIGRTEVDTDALAELLLFRFAAGRRSNFKGIELLPGGVFARYSIRDDAYSEHRFADVAATLRPDDSISPERAEQMAHDAILSSLTDHLQSDVGYSAQLSGGIDSSLVVAMATEKAGRKIDTYGIRLPQGAQDESEYRALVLERYPARHEELDLGAADFADNFPRAVAHMEGPVPHFGCVLLMLLCEQIRKRNKVVLTGEGADEFFGGYDRYAKWKQLRLHGGVARAVPPPLWPLVKRYAYLRRFSHFDPAIAASIYFDFLEVQRLFPQLVFSTGERGSVSRQFTDFRDRLLAVDQTSYLPSVLMRQDKMSMAASVESRVPFAHFPLAKVINRLPRNIRVPGGVTKPLLKAIARKWLPADVVDRRKVGLTLPLNRWLKDETGFGRYLEFLTQPDSKLSGYTDRRMLREIVDNFRQAPASDGMSSLANLVNVELWLRSLDTLSVPVSRH
jgi:asparagine synthase (glutamine-hydrolysing)